MTTDLRERREDFDRLLPVLEAEREAETDGDCRRAVAALIDAVEAYLLAVDEKRRQRR
jgi:hypothetical protein